jgi:hypothetical protein
LDALLLTGFPQQASGIVIGGLLLLSVLVPSLPEFRSRLRARLQRRTPPAGIAHSDSSVDQPRATENSDSKAGQGSPRS